MRYALKFAYDGAGFDGYARQPEGNTVEGEVVKAMTCMGIIEDITTSRFQSASRTDKGVSAAGNVMAIDTEFNKEGIIQTLNSELKGIRFYGIAEVGDDFNARRAKQRWYRYVLLRSQCPSLDGMQTAALDDMRAAAESFVGEHDFRHFSKRDLKDEVTRLKVDSIEISCEGQWVFVDMRARRFLWQMVRRVTGAILAMAEGTLEPDTVHRMLEGKDMEFRGVRPMPAEGLTLMDVDYGFEFHYPKKVKNPFGQLSESATVRSAVMGQIEKVISYD